MTATYEQGIDEIFTVFDVAWKQNSCAIIGGNEIPPVFWQGISTATIPANEKFYARGSQKTISDEQQTLSTKVGNGQRRYRIDGILTIEVYVPPEGQDFKKGRTLAAMVKDAYKGTITPLCVNFTNARIDEIGRTSKGYLFEIVVDYNHTYLA